MWPPPRPGSSFRATLRRTAGLWSAWWCGLFVTWLLLVDTFDVQELLVGVNAAALAATVAVAIHHRGFVRFAPRAAWISALPTVAWSVPVDTVVLGRALVHRLVLRRPVEGSTIRVPFHYGGDTGHDGARRALVNFAISITPNSYVIDIDPEAHSLLVHRLVPRELDPLLQREQRRAEAVAPCTGNGGDH